MSARGIPPVLNLDGHLVPSLPRRQTNRAEEAGPAAWVALFPVRKKHWKITVSRAVKCAASHRCEETEVS